MTHIDWYIGCSGFHYKEWKGVFYPKGLGTGKWFEYYARQFNTVESNVSFYRFPPLSMLQRWHERSPEYFSFSVKAPRSITHFKKFVDCGSLLADFYSLAKEGLQEKLGCILFQLPPSLPYSKEKLELICDELDPGFRNVIEFRHESWWQAEVYQRLKTAGICFCGISYPRLPDQVVCTAPVLYYRFHGVPHLYRSSYESGFLDEVVTKIQQCPKVRTVYLYFNNTMTAAAIDNIRYIENRYELRRLP